MTHANDEPATTPTLRDLLYRRHHGSTADDLGEAARGWLDAVHVFATEALEAGVSVSEVLPAAIQMLEGWMLARDAASLATTWMALDGAVTVLERRLVETRAERDNFRQQVRILLAEREARRDAVRARRRRRRQRASQRKG